MNKYLAFIVLLGLSVGLFAQETELISMDPHVGQGYIVLDAFDKIDEEYYEIKIVDRHYTEDGYNDEVIEIYELVGVNYTKIPFEFINNGSFIVQAIAHTPSGDVVEEYELDRHFPPMPYGWTTELTGTTIWQCDGPTYAWEIRQYIWDDSYSYFSLQAAGKDVDSQGTVVKPYYQYFSQQAFDAFQGNTHINYLGSGVNASDPYYGASYNEVNGYDPNFPEYTSPWVVKLINTPSVAYYDLQNNVINSSVVYGVGKALGPWAQSSCAQNRTTDNYAIGYPMAQSDKVLAMSYIDSHDDNNGDCLPDLECVFNANNPTGGSNPLIDKPWDSVWVDHEDDFKGKDTMIWPWELLRSADEFINGENEPNWWENYISFGITSVSNREGEVCFFDVAQWVESPGNPEDLSVGVSPGLYSINLQMANGEFMPIMVSVENEESEVNQPTLASKVSAVIYPNPIQEDHFYIRLSSTENLNTVYRLYDFNGEQIYESEIEISKGETADIQIQPDVEIPQGVLVNVFQFEDGSQLQKLTMK